MAMAQINESIVIDVELQPGSAERAAAAGTTSFDVRLSTHSAVPDQISTWSPWLPAQAQRLQTRQAGLRRPCRTGDAAHPAAAVPAVAVLGIAASTFAGPLLGLATIWSDTGSGATATADPSHPSGNQIPTARTFAGPLLALATIRVPDCLREGN